MGLLNAEFIKTGDDSVRQVSLKTPILHWTQGSIVIGSTGSPRELSSSQSIRQRDAHALPLRGQELHHRPLGS